MNTYCNSPAEGKEYFVDGRLRGVRSCKTRTYTREQWEALTEREKHGLDLPDDDDDFREEARLKETLDDGTSISAEAIGNGSNPDELIAKMKAELEAKLSAKEKAVEPPAASNVAASPTAAKSETEEESQPRLRVAGKWLEPDVPHSGWTCTSVKDLGESSHVCEMCGYFLVRYVSRMTHPNYRHLKVDFLCAGAMEGDCERARERIVRKRKAARAKEEARERAAERAAKKARKVAEEARRAAEEAERKRLWDLGAPERQREWDAAAPEREKRRLAETEQRRKAVLGPWLLSERGNEYIKMDGFCFVMFSRSGGLGGVMIDTETRETTFSKRTYRTADEFKRHVFSILEKKVPITGIPKWCCAPEGVIP